jgi:hypothetical protein
MGYELKAAGFMLYAQDSGLMGKNQGSLFKVSVLLSTSRPQN